MTTRPPLAGGLTALLLAAALLPGCGSSGSTATASAGNRPTTAAKLEITSPAPGAVTGRSVDLLLHLEHGRLVAPIQMGGRLYPDRGHIHVLVDGTLVAMPLRLVQPLPKLTRGVHTVEAEFVAADHLPFANAVVAAVTFRVK